MLPPQYRKEVREALSRYLPSRAEAQLVATDGGLSLARLQLDGAAETRWHNILAEAERHGPRVLAQVLELCLDRAPILALSLQPVMGLLSTGNASTRASGAGASSRAAPGGAEKTLGP